MNWEEKFAAMKALCHPKACEVRMRKPGNWYVDCKGISISAGGSLIVGAGVSEPHPQRAIQMQWYRWTDEGFVGMGAVVIKGAPLLVKDCLVPEKRRAYRWNGYMWEEQPPEVTP